MSFLSRKQGSALMDLDTIVLLAVTLCRLLERKNVAMSYYLCPIYLCAKVNQAEEKNICAIFPGTNSAIN